MSYAIHSTAAYHTEAMQTLGWELTVCNALWPQKSTCRKVLRKSDSYGHLLFDYLDRFFPISNTRTIMEIGGGYGCLMKDFRERHPFERVIMLDISPILLERQRQLLDGNTTEYLLEDFLETPLSRLMGIDLAILNENVGDFPTLIDLDRHFLSCPPEVLDIPLKNARRLFHTYDLAPPCCSPFHLNIGALEALEKLCLAGIPCIFIGEHSCEATIPGGLRGLVSVRSPGNPERIPLYGHAEYTIRFSDLEKVARAQGYRSYRGPFADFLEWDLTASLRRILTSRITLSDENEVIRQFIEDLYQYEYLILIRNPSSGEVSADQET